MKKFLLSLLIIFNTILFANSGKIYFFGNCISCHNEIGKKVAPPFVEIKGYYLLSYPNKKDFVENIAKWVYKPNHQTSKMKNAIKEYGLMPHLAIDLDTLKEIAKYIFENDDFGNR